MPAPVIFSSISWSSVILIVVDSSVVTDVDAAKEIDSRVKESDLRSTPPLFTVIDFTLTAELIFGVPLLMIISSVEAGTVCGSQFASVSQLPVPPFHKCPPAEVTVQLLVPEPVVSEF